MPVVSKAQGRAMFAAAAGNSTLGIPKSVGADFVNATPPGGIKNLPEKVGMKPPRHHALMMASATALHNHGHIDTATRDKIHAHARAGLAKHRMHGEPMGAKAIPMAAPRPFGALAMRRDHDDDGDHEYR